MKQIVVYADNRVGVLSGILRILSNEDINVRAISTERANLSEIRLIVDNEELAKEKLEEQMYNVHIMDIVVVKVNNAPGELAHISEVLEENNINIEYIYGIDNGKEDKGLFAIRTPLDAEELKSILAEFPTL